MKWNIMLSVLLISLLAVGAYAQTENEPVKQQTREDGSENAVNPGTGDRNQNYDEYENEKPAAPHDPTGPAGSTAQGDANQGPQDLTAEKSGDQTQDAHYGDGDGDNHELGENERHGADYTGEGGPHGSVAESTGLDAEKSGDMVQDRKYGDGDGSNHELGETRRNGDEFTGEGGPHGPMGTGPVESFLKMFGLEETFGFDTDSAFDKSGDGTCEGDMLQHSWGPGTSDLGGHFGPNDGVGFGPGVESGDGDPETSGTGIQSRSGRR